MNTHERLARRLRKAVKQGEKASDEAMLDFAWGEVEAVAAELIELGRHKLVHRDDLAESLRTALETFSQGCTEYDDSCMEHDDEISEGGSSYCDHCEIQTVLDRYDQEDKR